MLKTLSETDAGSALQAEPAAAAAAAGADKAAKQGPATGGWRRTPSNWLVGTRWMHSKHTIRLVHILIELKADFLVRDKSLSREQLDGAPALERLQGVAQDQDLGVPLQVSILVPPEMVQFHAVANNDRAYKTES